MYKYGLLAVCLLVASADAAGNYSSRLQARKQYRNADLPPAQQAEVDDMVNNLLHWIQALYQQKNRKARQYFGGRPERPRPFEAATYLPPFNGYPAAGNKPTPTYEEGTQSPASSTSSQGPYQPSIPDQPFEPQQMTYQPSHSQPTFRPRPTQTAYQPTQPTQPAYQPSQPTQPAYEPSKPSYAPSQPTEQQPTQPEYQPSQPSYQPSQAPSTNQPAQPSYQPSTSQPEKPYEPNQEPEGSEQSGVIGSTAGSTVDSNVGTTVTQNSINEDEDRHPPHIHAITVDCGKEMMTINVEFNKPYNGIIYSQDHFNEQECVYVRENSNQVKFSFTVSLNRCGTRFFSDFENEGQAYLENVLVFQNEPGIQEVWDHIRRVRCLWEGNLTKQLVSSLSVGMLNQITSNFSGDTAMARLDIQAGRGPFASEANGLIKIGEIMTLVVSVTGDPGFDVFVRECVAHDADNRHVVPLTDNNGCVLKPKLFGSFQKTRETGNTGASIIAYAYFNAFKFPDEMDLIIQCNVELCKTDCEACPSPGSIEPKRRRRDVIHVGNRTIEPSTTLSKGLRVVFADDLPAEAGFCISSSAAMWGACLVLFGSLMSSLLVSYLFGKTRGVMKFT